MIIISTKFNNTLVNARKEERVSPGMQSNLKL